MEPEAERFKETKVIAGAIQNMGIILRPYAANEKDLVAVLDEVDGKNAAEWYPVSILIRLLDIAKKNGVLQRLAENRALLFVHYFATIKKIQDPMKMLDFIDKAYKDHHQGDAGSISCRYINDRSVAIIDSTYYPCEYTTPLLLKVISSVGGEDIEQNHPPEKCRQHGAKVCRTIVSWKEGDLLRIRK
jgi:hypothetical protein